MLKRILMGIAALGVVALFFIGATAKRTTADSPFDTSPDSILKEPEDDTEYLGIPVTPMTREEIEQSAEEVFLQGNYTPLAVGDPLVAVSDEQAKSWEEVDWFEHFPEDMQDGLLALEQNSTSPSLPPPLNRSVQAIAPGRTGEKEFALFGGDGGVHRLIRDKDNGWTSEPFGLPISFISRLGHLPDGGLYAADYWNFYTLYPGDSSWQLVYNPEETGGGAVYDVAIVGDADDYTLYLATLKGVWAGKPDTNDWRLVSPPDAMAWSAVAVNNDAVYFGGERVADQPSPQSSNNEEPEEPETVGVVWKLDINSNEWQMAAEWPELPIVRGMIYDPEMGVIAQGQGGVRFEQLGWQAAPGDEGFREIYASLVDEQGVWVGGVGKDGLQLFSRDGKWHTYPLDGISINATVSSLQRVENLMLAGTSDGLVVLELDDSDSLVSRQYLPPPDKASMRVLYKPPTPYYTGHDWGQLYNWKWCEVKAGVPVEIKFYPQSGPDFREAVYNVTLWHWYQDTWASSERNGDSATMKLNETCNQYYNAWAERDGYQIRKGYLVRPGSISNGRRCHMGVYFSASDYGDIQADTESDFSASLGAWFSQMRGSEQSALWLRSGADVSLETAPRNQDTSDNGLQILVNGSWRHPEAVSLNAGATYQFRVHVNDPTWNSAYVRAWADWNGTSGGGVYRIDSFGDARRSSGWYTFNVTIPNDAQSISWLRTHVAHEPTDGPNQFTYNYPTGARWVTGEIEDYRLSIVRGTDLSITKTDAPDPVKMGEQLVWTLQVRNNGPSEAINVTVQDTIPAGLTYETSSGDYSCSHTSSIDCPFSSLAVNESRIMPISGFSCSHTPSTRSIDCSLSSLAVNESRTIQITVFVPTGYSSNQISNTAIVSSSSLELNPDDNQDTEITTVISEADLSIIKTDSPDPVMAGNQLTWTLSVRNDGPADALNVIVRDTIPANLTFVSATSALFNCNYNSGAREVICTSSASSGALGVGQTASISLVVNVPPNYAANSITNTASVFTTTDDPDPSNDQDTEITTIEKRADLSIVKTDTPDPVLAGNTLQYSLSVTNNGPSTADNVVVSDVLPNGTTYQNVFGPADWNCNYNGGARSISCTKPSMDVGETALINLSLQVDSDYPGNSISNTGRITSDTTDPDLGDNQDTEITTVEKRADLSITKSDTPDPVAPGEVIRYALSVSNNGPSDAINARVTDTLPPGLLYVGTSPPAGWSCDYQAATRTLTCSISRLVVGATADIMLDVSVPSTYPGGGTISNTAVTTSDTPDPNPGDNQDTEDTSVSIVWGVSPPSGYVFTHIRVDNELNPGAQDQKDYLADEYIPGHLQVPVEMGMAFHTDSPPSLCTTNVTPCPATELVEGTVMVESFAVTEVENLKTNEIKVFSTGSDVTMNRYSEPSIPACTLGRCVAFGSFLAPNYVWADPDEYVYLYWQHPDGEPLECPAGYQCWTIPDSEPGYYAVRGTVALTVDFPGYPELRRTYTLDGTANYEIIASFAQPSSR